MRNVLLEKEAVALLKSFIGQPNTEVTRLKIKSILTDFIDKHTPKTFRVEMREVRDEGDIRRNLA